jgi:hypothetical protein
MHTQFFLSQRLLNVNLFGTTTCVDFVGSVVMQIMHNMYLYALMLNNFRGLLGEDYLTR